MKTKEPGRSSRRSFCSWLVEYPSAKTRKGARGAPLFKLICCCSRNFRSNPDDHSRSQAEWCCQFLRMLCCNICCHPIGGTRKVGSYTSLVRLPWFLLKSV